MVFKRIANWFKRVEDPSDSFELPVDEEEIFKKSKLILQQLDEYITSSELESENLCIQLDTVLAEQEVIRTKIQGLNKPDSWHERNLLLKLDRLVVHGDNLKRRIELFSQNIKVYLNLMSKVEDIRAMHLNGLETDKIQNIWLEFQHSLETYKDKITTEAVTETTESVLSGATEERLIKLRQQLLGSPEKKEEAKEEVVSPPQESVRPLIENLFRDASKEMEDVDIDEDDEGEEWNSSIKNTAERMEEE